MMMKKIFLTFGAGVFLWTHSYTQELKCAVTVNSNQIAQVDRSIFDALEKGIYEFMNNTVWTEETYSEEEKIECGIFINITEQEKDNNGQVVADRYKGTITVQSRRPVYGTSYYTTLLNYQDQDFVFNYILFQQFYYSKNTSLSNLTAILAFYAYYIIALDYDSFSPKGGDKYMTEAQNIVSNSQNLGEPGWKAFEGNSNRYYLVSDYLNPAFAPLRDLMYNYNRLGLDVLQSDQAKGRAEMINSLKNLDKIWNQRPNAFLLRVFFATKRNEIIDMLKGTPLNEKADLIPILKKVDPAHGSKYEELNTSSN